MGWVFDTEIINKKFTDVNSSEANSALSHKGWTGRAPLLNNTLHRSYSEASMALDEALQKNAGACVRFINTEGVLLKAPVIDKAREKVTAQARALLTRMVALVEKTEKVKTRTCPHCGSRINLQVANYTHEFERIKRLSQLENPSYHDVYLRTGCNNCNEGTMPYTPAQIKALEKAQERMRVLGGEFQESFKIAAEQLHKKGELEEHTLVGALIHEVDWIDVFE